MNEHQTFPRSKKLKGEGVEIPFTLEQEIEYLKCAMDPLYFAKNYYKITSIDSGFVNFDPFPYQEELIKAFHDHRFVIDMQSRQSGKCVRGDSIITVRHNPSGEVKEIEIEKFHNRHRGTTENLSTFSKRDNSENKFVEIFKVEDYEVLTDKGWSPIGASNKTIEYEEYRVLTESGMTLFAADTHICFDEYFNEVFVKDLHAGSWIQTENGVENVIGIKNTGKHRSMYDLQVDSEEHRYFTNGILSHNTTVVGAYILHFVLFNEHKEVFVLANKEKQAIEILTRIRKALLDLPFFLMPGVVKYGSTEVEFENGSKVVAYATSSDSIRGRSCVIGETQVTIKDSDSVRSVDVESLYHDRKEAEGTPFSDIVDFRKNDTNLKVQTDSGSFRSFVGVIRNEKETARISTKNGFELTGTTDHKVLTKHRSWVELQDLNKRDLILTKSGYSKVLSITHTGKKELVYDLVGVEETEAYFTNGIYSHNCALLYIDEVAFIENDMEFWESTYPAVGQSATSKVIMTSTPKGQRGLFYKTWCEAEVDENGVSNGFHRVEVKWDKVPTYANDPTWKEKTIKRLGEARFQQEYGCSFRGSVGTLLSVKAIENMVSTNPKQEPDEWTKVYLPYDAGRKYVAIADVGGGTGGDYSVLRVMDVSSYPYRTAALYRNNEISPMLYPHIIVSLCESYGGCSVLVENNNDMGGQAITVLYYDLEYEGTLKTASDKQKGTGTKIGGKGSKPGIRTNYRVRSVGCSNMKSMIENGFILVNDLETIYELGNFILLGDKYQADNGCNDDCVMTLVLFSWLAKQEWFQEEFGRNIATDLYHKVVAEDSFKLPVAGGTLYASTPEEIVQQTSFGVIPVTEHMDFETWAGT